MKRRWVILLFLFCGALLGAEGSGTGKTPWYHGISAKYFLSVNSWLFNDSDNASSADVSIVRTPDIIQNFNLDLPFARWLKSYFFFSFNDITRLSSLFTGLFGTGIPTGKVSGSIETGLKWNFAPLVWAIMDRIHGTTTAEGREADLADYLYLGYRVRARTFTWNGNYNGSSDYIEANKAGYVPFGGTTSLLSPGDTYSSTNKYLDQRFVIGLDLGETVGGYAGLLFKTYRTALPVMMETENAGLSNPTSNIFEIDTRITALDLGGNILFPILGDIKAGIYGSLGLEVYFGSIRPVLDGYKGGASFGLGSVWDLAFNMWLGQTVKLQIGNRTDYSFFAAFNRKLIPTTKPLVVNSFGSLTTLPSGTPAYIWLLRNEALLDFYVSVSVTL